mmetsp:Transcript_22567/g.43885  ORF Transcript_22567/g.43885 Transcript_22567/m.43885 type:complete len:111 (+) Transcript_22567:150-482(+)
MFAFVVSNSIQTCEAAKDTMRLHIQKSMLHKEIKGLRECCGRSRAPCSTQIFRKAIQPDAQTQELLCRIVTNVKRGTKPPLPLQGYKAPGRCAMLTSSLRFTNPTLPLIW